MDNSNKISFLKKNPFLTWIFRYVVDILQDQFKLALIRLENVVWGTICGAIKHKLILTLQNLLTSTLDGI